jgi:type VI secretion system protein
MQVNVADLANQNYPIPMDLVTVSDKKVIAEIGKLTAKDWFERRMQVLRDFHGKVAVASWEWVPGQHAGPISVEISPKTRVAYVFANYLNAGGHRALVDVKTPVVVNLGPEDFTIQPLK